MSCAFLVSVMVSFFVMHVSLTGRVNFRIRVRFMVRVRVRVYAYNQGWGLRIRVQLTEYS